MVATSSCAVADGGHNRRAPVAQRIVIQRVVIQRVVIQRFTESSPGTLIGYRPCFFLCSRAKVTPRFSAAARSVSGVTICTGLPDTVRSHSVNCWGELETNRPCSNTGIPSDFHRFTTETGSPRKSAICFHPFRGWSSGLAVSLDCFGMGNGPLCRIYYHRWLQRDCMESCGAEIGRASC